MTKKLLALLATVVLTTTLVLAGCSQAETPAEDDFVFEDDFLLEEVVEEEVDEAMEEEAVEEEVMEEEVDVEVTE